MTSSERQGLKQKIEDDLAITLKELADLELLLEPIAPDCSLGYLGRSEAMIEQEVATKRFSLATIRLNKLRFALSKIDNKDYGICEVCDEMIVLGRLMIMPEVTRCPACAD